MRKTCWVLFICSLSSAAAFAQPTPKNSPQSLTSGTCRITATYQGGLVDNYGSVADPRVWSPALTTYMSGKPTRQYDEKACDKILGESFLINKCQVCEMLCTAEVEIRYKPSGCGLDCNDTITIGQAPFTGSGTILASGQLYSPCPPPPPDGTDTTGTARQANLTTPGAAVTKRFPLDPVKVKALCAKAPGAAFWIDMVVQDDTNVDYIKLILTY